MRTDHPRDRMLAGLPVTEHRLRAGGVSTMIVEAGEGTPLILLHGGIECGGAYWAPVIGRLAERHRVIVPDAPGLGESEPVDRLDADVFGRWLREVVEGIGAERPTLVVHSMIGSLVARFATDGSDLLARLVLYGVPAVGPYRLPIGLLITAMRFGMRPTARNAERFDRWALLDLDETRERDPVWFDAFQTYSRARATVPHVKRTMRRLVAAGKKQIPVDDLRRIAVPTTLLWGRQDRMVTLDIAEWASARAGWPLELIDDAGHAAHLDQPESFVQALSAIDGAAARGR